MGYTLGFWKIIKKPAGTELDSERWWHVLDLAIHVQGEEPHIPTVKEAKLWGWVYVPDFTFEDLQLLQEPVMETVGLETRVKTPRRRKIDMARLRDSMDEETAATLDSIMDPKTSFEYTPENFPTLSREDLVLYAQDKTKAEVTR